MPSITFILRDGQKRIVEAAVGKTIMFAAVANLIDGIVADCGGFCTCATCHVYIENSSEIELPPPTGGEIDMLECANEPRTNSRLSCQIEVTASMDGLVISVPESQA